MRGRTAKDVRSRKKKNASTSGDNILAKSYSILKKYERFGIAFQFPTIWEVAQLSSSFCSKVTSKNVNFMHSIFNLQKGKGNLLRNKFVYTK